MNTVTTGIEFTATSGSPTISSTTVRSGTYAGRISSLASATQMRFRLQYVSSAGNGPYFARLYLRVHTAPSAANRIITMRDTGNGADRCWITLDNSSTLALFNGGGSQIGSSSSALTADTWYMVELRIDRSPAGGSQIIEARLNGTVFATSSAQTISTNAGDTLNFGGNLNGEAQTTGDWFFDDIAVNDSTGSFQKTYPGSGKIIALRPNAAGDANSFVTQTGGTAGSSNNYTRVNEVTPDDATTFNGSSTLNQEDLFNVTDSGLTVSDMVNCVFILMRFRNNTADATTAIKAEIEKTASGTIQQSSALIPNSTLWKTTSTGSTFPIGSLLVAYQDPDGANWTKSTLDTMQIGYKLTAVGTNRIDVTNIAAMVDYTSNTSAFFSIIGM